MSQLGLGALAAGTVVLAGSVAAALGPTIAPWERRAFRAVNGLPDWLFAPLWLPMQLGNLVVGTLAGLAVAAAVRDVALAVGVVVAVALKLVVERVVRRRMHDHISVRQRPGTSQPGARLRGRDVPSAGPSFPSGHVILVAAVACVIVDVVSPVVGWVPFGLTALVMLGRVYVGAHNPLDVTAGLGAGLLVGGGLAVVLR